MLSSNGNGNVSVKYVEPNTVRVTAGGNTVVDFNPNDATFSQDIVAPGGQLAQLTYFKNIIQGQTTAMTASAFVSASQGLLAGTGAQLKRPMLRAGSVLGLCLYTENVNFTAIGTNPFVSGALTASVTIDGANTALTLVCEPTGSTFVSVVAKNLYPFSASQKIGVSLTASAGYGSDHLASSASWLAVVMVEA